MACKHCQEDKPESGFKPNPRCVSGFSSWCRDCHNAAVRAWRAKDATHARAVQSASDLRRRGQAGRGGGPLPTKLIVAMRKSAKRCALCGCKFAGVGGRRPEIDHIVPFAVGGSNSVDNLRVICQICNRTRPKDGSDLSEQVRLWQVA